MEHILGAASLQLGLAAAAARSAAAWKKPADGVGETVANAVPSTPDGDKGVTLAPAFEPSRPTEIEVSKEAARGRRPWGYGTGPFAQVSATKGDVFVEGGGGGGDGGADAVDGVGADEEAIIAQLEVNDIYVVDGLL